MFCETPCLSAKTAMKVETLEEVGAGVAGFLEQVEAVKEAFKRAADQNLVRSQSPACDSESSQEADHKARNKER